MSHHPSNFDLLEIRVTDDMSAITSAIDDLMPAKMDDAVYGESSTKREAATRFLDLAPSFKKKSFVEEQIAELFELAQHSFDAIVEACDGRVTPSIFAKLENILTGQFNFERDLAKRRLRAYVDALPAPKDPPPPIGPDDKTKDPDLVPGVSWQTALIPIVVGLAVAASGLFHVWLAVSMGALGTTLCGWRIWHSRLWQKDRWWTMETTESQPVWCAAACVLAASVAWAASPPNASPNTNPAGSERVIATPDPAPRPTPVAPPPPKETELFKASPPYAAPVRQFMADPVAVIVPGSAEANGFPASRAVDGDIGTCWQAPLDSSCQLAIRLREPLEIDAVALVNGSANGESGAAIAKVRLEFDEGDAVELNLSDFSGWQLHAFEPRRTKEMKLIVQSLHNAADAAAPAALAELWCCHHAGFPPPGMNWQGAWQASTMGEIEFQQKGAWVTGAYAYGRVVARAVENDLFGTWQMQPENPSSRKFGELHLSASGNDSFGGKWRNGYDGAWNHDKFWNGRRKVD